MKEHKRQTQSIEKAQNFPYYLTFARKGDVYLVDTNLAFKLVENQDQFRRMLSIASDIERFDIKRPGVQKKQENTKKGIGLLTLTYNITQANLLRLSIDRPKKATP